LIFALALLHLRISYLKNSENPSCWHTTNSIIIRLSRLGWTYDKISEITGMTLGRVAQIINNANFCEINNFPPLLNCIILAHKKGQASNKI